VGNKNAKNTYDIDFKYVKKFPGFGLTTPVTLILMGLKRAK